MSNFLGIRSYWRECTRMTTRKLCLIGILIALQVVLSRIAAINIGNWLRISFGFLPIAVAGYLLGPVYGLLVGGISDLLGAALFTPPILWGLTAASALTGLFFGLVLYRGKVGWVRAALSLLPVLVVCNFLLNTYFLARAGFTILSDGADWPAFFRALVLPVYPAGAQLPAWISVCNRLIKQLVALPVNTVMLYFLLRGISKLPGSILRR